ncbi:HIT domain-containing protein [Ancylobacter sp. SL191]|jgi:diadenosine tetraphosphate (Ap4A) HIT family hydrolase|uniref:HIT domain-containing protein n=1 Tax=Ancylobacter sp. SL191 TaxID=2995166 RepID=UPI00226F104B|nr:HIT domain-containing protein [Ancylobacter sp. SL191]WAC27722.1 HIT domain-containing protein [Ancylobacter sp. SL191]
MSEASGFRLDPRLEADTFPVGDLSLCTVRLMNDARFPWLILVPRQPDLAELIDLDDAARARLTTEIDAASRVLKAATGCDKLNVAALGNMVRQLHIHVIARFTTDAAWPGPVWGVGQRKDYAAPQAMVLAGRLRRELGCA